VPEWRVKIAVALERKENSSRQRKVRKRKREKDSLREKKMEEIVASLIRLLDVTDGERVLFLVADGGCKTVP